MKRAQHILLAILWLTLTLFVTSQTTFAQSRESGHATTSQAAADSGAAVFEAEALDRLVLEIASEQVVGYPLHGTARVLLLDENSALVTDYDFAGDPIQLAPDSGLLAPDVISDSSLFAAGVVDFLPLGVVYEGSSGTVAITASNSGVSSLSTLVSYSGYEILSVFDRLGDPVESVYSDLPATIKVPVSNGGDLLAESEPTLKAFFASGGGSVKVFFPPKTSGMQDTLEIDLPTTGLSAGEDTLVLVLESAYQPADSLLAVTDTVRTPVTILPSADFGLVEGSLVPESVFVGVSFDMSFDVSTGGFAGPIDSTSLAVHLVSASDSVIATIYDGSPKYAAFEDSIISYADLEAMVDSSLGLTEGWFDVRLDFRLSSGGSVFCLDPSPTDSLFLLLAPALGYVPGSFGPVEVSSGQESTFEFDFSLGGSSPVHLDYDLSWFLISGGSFSAAASLVVEGDSLIPGLNHVTTGQVFIPPSHLGDSLEVAATVTFHREGSANWLTFTTDFDSQAVVVEELPTVQITEVSVVAPNSPNVNTNQEFRISFRIANLSTTDQPPFNIRLVSDGASVFESDHTIPGVPGESVIDSFIVVQASPVANASEIFRVDITSLGVNQLPPIDNIAQAMIQEPALLTVSVLLRGASDGYVTVNDDFDLILTIVNSGEAETSDGEFTLTTNGLDLGVPDPLVLSVEVGQPAGIEFLAPSFDTSLTINFGLTEIPLDINTGLPAQIGETEFETNLAVLSEDLELLVSAEPVLPNVVFPGKTRDLIRLVLDNKGTSSVTAVAMQSMSFALKDAEGQPVSVRSVLEVGSTGLFDGLREVTRATAGGNRLNLTFEDYIINGTSPVELVLRSRILANAGGVFGVSLMMEDIKAVFASGPIGGQQVEISSQSGEEEVVSEVFTTVAADLVGSFIIRDNPFNPLSRPAEFQFFQAEAGTIVFRILTLSGEIVYRKTLPAEGLTGSRTLEWDGRNDRGQMVLNGVYLAVLTDEWTGAQAVLKVAVLK
ncbi:MAG: hypothetical protein GY867_02675 [bacterium]|nr:hypothetical protein [bacterium]